MDSFVFALGCLAMLQMLMLPGYIMLRLLRVELSLSRSVLLCIALSLLLNYILVVVLTLLHSYTTHVLWAISVVELITVLLLLSTKRPPWPVLGHDCASVHAYHQTCLKDKSGWQAFWQYGVLTLALFSVGYFLYQVWLQLGQIFTAWDPVMSYNVWATDWAKNQLPTYTWHYPQLLPANWSLAYVMIGTLNGAANLQIFPKAIMPLFALLILWNLLSLGIEKHQPGYLLGVSLCAYLLLSLVGSNLGQGWVDVAVAFSGFLFVSLLLVADEQHHQWRRWIWLGALVCAAGAVTKQAGLYLLLLYPVLTGLLMRGDDKPGRWGHIIGAWVVALLITLPWYGYIQWKIMVGLGTSEIGFVTDQIYQASHLSLALRLLWPFFAAGLGTILLFAISWLYALRGRQWRPLFCWVVMPYTLIWMVLYSYSLRNFTLMLPFIAAMAGCELWQAGQSGWLSVFVTKIVGWVRQFEPAVVFVVVMVVVIVLSVSPYYYWQKLNARQYDLQTYLGDTTLNWKLYRYYHEYGFSGKILTSWDFLGHLPLLKQYYQPWRPGSVEGNPIQSAWMLNPAELKPVLAHYPVRYILETNQGGLVSKRFHAFLLALAMQGKLKQLVTLPHMTLYKIMVPYNELGYPQ